MTVQKLIRERRQSVWVMLCKGMQQKDIAKSLNVSEATITSDIKVLQEKSEQFLNDLAKRTLPFMYEKCIGGINEVIKECWAIYHNTDNPQITQWHKQSALKLAKDADLALFQLTSEGPAVMTVKRLQEQVKELRRQDNNDDISKVVA